MEPRQPHCLSQPHCLEPHCLSQPLPQSATLPWATLPQSATASVSHCLSQPHCLEPHCLSQPHCLEPHCLSQPLPWATLPQSATASVSHTALGHTASVSHNALVSHTAWCLSILHSCYVDNMGKWMKHFQKFKKVWLLLPECKGWHQKHVEGLTMQALVTQTFPDSAVLSHQMKVKSFELNLPYVYGNSFIFLCS